MSQQSSKDILKAAVNILSRKLYSEYEIRCKLSSKGYTTTSIDIAIKELTKRGYIDDAALCDILIRKYYNASKYSQNYIILKLKGRGLDEHLIDSTLNKYTDFDEFTAAINALKKRYSNPETIETVKVTRYLLSKGFSFNTVNTITYKKI